MRPTELLLKPETMKQFARYELTLPDLLGNIPPEDVYLSCQDTVPFTLDLLSQTLKSLKKVNPSIGEFDRDWLTPISDLETEFALDKARGFCDDFDDTPENLTEYRDLPLSDSDCFDSVWSVFEEICQCFEDVSLPLSEVLDFDHLLKTIERHMANKGKPILEWDFSNEEKTAYIYAFKEDRRVNEATENERILSRKFIEELIHKDSILALHIKGYACYGGNLLFDCDWNTARDYMTRLFDMTDDAQYANTLGYIFYYGRCNNGIPEYDRAFRAFGISAANGLYEGMYKLADMYANGYGCRQSANTAKRLYDMVYEDSYRSFLKGEHANFADAALRMGNVFLKGIAEKPDPVTAYYYYLEAEYAIRLRLEQETFYGDHTVARTIQNALSEAKAKIPESYFCESVDFPFPLYMKQLVEENGSCLLTRTQKEDGSWILTAVCINTKRYPYPVPVLITIPQMSLCRKATVISMTAVGVTKLLFRDDTTSICFDCVDFNYEKNQVEFYLGIERTARIRCESFRFDPDSFS